jgi:creatinine amidohydrolase/Fe(II)-dependent formamide hydrolase-like protein
MLHTNLNTFDPALQQKRVFLVSLGALEQHGRFAPLGSDDFIQNALIEKVEAALPEVIFLPTIPVGPSWQHVGFRGTISLESATLYAIIRDIVTCLRDNASMIIFVSWHGGNKPTVTEFIDKEQANFAHVKLVQLTFGDESTDELAEKLIAGPTDDHAGNTEVSIMLALRPDITKQPAASDGKENVDFDWDKHIKDVTANGEIDSNPAWKASAEVGQKLVTIYSDNLIKKIRALQG